jgi:2OG-Fe(II) oxygenase superfamily
MNMYCSPLLLFILSLTIIDHVAHHSIMIEGASPLFQAGSKMAFAGFGASKTSAADVRANKKSERGKQAMTEPPLPDILTAEGRMLHIASCIQRADVSPMGVQQGGALNPNSICYVDDFLGSSLISALRAEAESLISTMVPSLSTRWDDKTQSVVSYEKEGVMSTQIEGGPEGYTASPRLVEYVVTLTKHLSEKINAMVPLECRLSGTEQTNKLAVCLGGGSKYDKHIDNLGGGDGMGDRRKMTALLYLQPSGSHADEADEGENDPRGGYFRAYDVPNAGKVTALAPRGDRLLLFWSDALVHDVSPSFTPAVEADRRWALTVWFVVAEGGAIRATNAEIEQRHFGTG